MFNFGGHNLPEEVVLRIFGFFGERDLASARRVSRDLNRIAGDNSIWLDHLRRTFHFTIETASALRERRNNATYQELYHFCRRYRLNQDQTLALQHYQAQGVIMLKL
jgi:hypothetical protein